VFLGVVHSTDVVDLKKSTAVLVHDLECLQRDGFTEGVHLSNDIQQELVKVDASTLIIIEDDKETLGIRLVESDSEVMDALHELRSAKVTGSVIISNSEGAPEGSDTTGSSLGKSGLHLELELLVREAILTSGVDVSHWLFSRSSLAVAKDVRLLHLVSLSTGRSTSHTGFSGASTIKVPSVVHHDLEVLVSVNAARHIAVVFDELVLSDDAISLFAVPHVVVGLEGLKELSEDLRFGSLSRNDVRMPGSIVHSLNIFKLENAIAVFIHLSEGLEYHRLAHTIHGSTDTADELIVLNEAILVEIEVGVKLLNLTETEAEGEVSHAFGKLILVKTHGVVVVHNLKLPGKADDSTGSSGS